MRTEVKLKISGYSSKDGIIFRGDKSYVDSKINKSGNQNIKIVIEENILKNKFSHLFIIRYYFGSKKTTIANIILFLSCVGLDLYYKGNIMAGICIYLILLVSLIFCLPQNKLVSGFHGAEHKAINAFNSYGHVSIEGIMKSSRIARGCGTNWALMYLFISVVITIALRKFYFTINYINYGLTRELFMIDNIDNSPIFFIIFKIGDYLQDRFLTKEPSDEQLELAKNAINILIDYEEK